MFSSEQDAILCIGNDHSMVEFRDVIDSWDPVYEAYNFLISIHTYPDITSKIEIRSHSLGIIDAIAHCLQQPSYIIGLRLRGDDDGKRSLCNFPSTLINLVSEFI